MLFDGYAFHGLPSKGATGSAVLSLHWQIYTANSAVLLVAASTHAQVQCYI